MTAASDDIPQGFARHFRTSPATDPWEPLFSKVGDKQVVLGMRIRSAHCNSKGFLHGGVLSALADNAMGLSAIQAANAVGLRRARAGVTLNLGIDFLSTGGIGQWLEVVPRVLKVGRSIAFVDCVVSADGNAVARASASFRVFSADEPDQMRG